MLLYVDTSALVKFVLPEQESERLRRWVDATGVRFIACDPRKTELMRAVLRSNPYKAEAVHEVLRSCGMVRLDASVYELAGRIDPVSLGSLDAIHLAAAQMLGSQLNGILTYDKRLAEAAARVGIRPISVGE